MASLEESVRKAISVHLPRREVLAVKDRGVWDSHIIEVTLDGNEKVFVKASIHEGEPGYLPFDHGSGARFMRECGLPAPRILASDASCKIIKHPFIIQEWAGGTRLGTLLDQVGEAEAEAIYETIGRLYCKMHSVHNDRSGVWTTNPREVFSSPNDYMFRAEILEGSGKRAVVEKRVSYKTYYRAVTSWARNMDYLNDHRPSLVHLSPFLWSIYLDKVDDEWQVIKLMALSRCWWDPAVDLANLQYPPFGEYKPERWEAFLRGYGPAPERKRILLYAILHRFMAAMGGFMEPKSERNKAWAETCLDDLDPFMDEIESYG